MTLTPETKARLEAAGHEAALSYVNKLAEEKTRLGQIVAEQYERSLDQVLGEINGQTPKTDD